MKLKTALSFSLPVLLGIMLLTPSTFAQKGKNEVYASLEKKTPTLTFTNEEGYDTWVQLVTDKGEPALKLPFFHHHSSRFSHYKGCFGNLIVTATRVAFVSDEDPTHSWETQRSAISKVKVGVKNGVLEIKAPAIRDDKAQGYINAARQGRKPWEWYWWDNGYKKTDNFQMLDLSFTSFEAALKQFKELAAEVIE